MRDLALSLLALVCGAVLLALALSGCHAPEAQEPEPSVDRELHCFSGAARGVWAGGESDAMFCSKTEELCELIQLGAAGMVESGDDDLAITTLSKCKVLRVAVWVK